GRSCFSVLSEYKIDYRKAGENAAAGYYKPEDVVEAWMSSDGHRANILKPNYDKIGIGFVYSDDSYGAYWVQLFIDE
ncbi:MAG: CAP domain-containing protein, partial [Oscillospiraceae bacterium]|nr:CAP domain-containing protein [Oscillospiraceae bacterium]